MKKLQKQRYHIDHKNISKKHGNEKHSKIKRVKLRYALIWNKCVQTVAQTIEPLSNMSTVDRY